MKRTPEDDAVLMRSIACAREELGDASFAAEEAAGRALTYEAAVDDARLWLSEPAAEPNDIGCASHRVARVRCTAISHVERPDQ